MVIVKLISAPPQVFGSDCWMTWKHFMNFHFPELKGFYCTQQIWCQIINKQKG